MPDVIAALPACGAKRIALLEAGPYRADRCRAFDLFPRTGHVETVVLMSESCALDRDVGK